MKIRILFILLFLTVNLFAQTTEDEKVSAVRTIYYDIENNLSSFEKYEKRYSEEPNGEIAHYYIADYVGFYNRNQLVKLEQSTGDEGYWSRTEFYYKDGTLYFVFENSGDPMGDLVQRRIYFYNNKIVRALIKKTSEDGGLDFSKVSNKKDTELLSRKSDAEKQYLRWSENAIKEFSVAK